MERKIVYAIFDYVGSFVCNTGLSLGRNKKINELEKLSKKFSLISTVNMKELIENLTIEDESVVEFDKREVNSQQFKILNTVGDLLTGDNIFFHFWGF